MTAVHIIRFFAWFLVALAIFRGLLKTAYAFKSHYPRMYPVDRHEDIIGALLCFAGAFLILMLLHGK